MAIKSPFTITKKYPKFTAHVTIINFDPDKHPDFYNRRLAEFILKKAKSMDGE